MRRKYNSEETEAAKPAVHVKIEDPLGKEDETGSGEQYEIVHRKNEAITVEITLSESVESNFAYAKLLSSLRDLPHNVEAVHLYLANFGGSCHTGVQLYNAFKNCSVPVDVTVSAPSYSMGAILALSGRSLSIDQGAFLMFHNYSSFDMGKGGELTTGVVHWAKYFERYTHKILKPFLTEKEIKLLNKDQDVYVTWDDPDLKQRIKRHFHGGK